MKAKITAVIVTGLLLVLFGFWFYRSVIGKNVILLTDGRAVEVQDFHKLGSIYYCTGDDRMFKLEDARVEEVLSLRYGLLEILPLVKFYIDKQTGHVRLLYVSGSTSPLDQYFDGQVLLLAIFTVVAGIGLFRLFRFSYQRLDRHIKARAVTQGGRGALQEEMAFDFGIDIVRFFQEIYKHQLNLPPDAATGIRSTPEKAAGAAYIYELIAWQGNRQVSRRIAISPLGEESGSKSVCYYVIYDVHLVVKIPPRPIEDFEVYVNSMQQEGRIAAKLAPRECIIPRLSAILRRVHKFKDEEDLSLEDLEERYLTLVRQRPELQKFMKIGGTFVYFMDLSRYYFLGRIVDDLHDIDALVRSEINNYPDLIWTPDQFEMRYKIALSETCQELADLYEDYQRQVNALFKRFEIDGSRMTHHLKKWFLTHLGGDAVIPKDGNPPEAFTAELNRLLDQLLTQNPSPVKAFRIAIRNHVREIALFKNKSRMGALISNLLELLAWLDKKGIALRDIKPDNLLVAGDTSHYPNFLADAGQFKIGIIDVETAVDFMPGKKRPIEQPMLGGTAYYATPSHFFPNAFLEHHLGAPQRIFPLQDWQAMLAMCYEIVKGEYLFKNTARQFPKLAQQVHQAQGRQEQIGTLFKTFSIAFWEAADREFKRKREESEELLQAVKVDLPSAGRELLYRWARKAHQELQDIYKSRVATQSVYRDEKQRTQLLQASITQLHNLKARYKNTQNADRVIGLLDDLLQLQVASENLKDLQKVLKQPDFKPTAHDVLGILHEIVLTFMYRRLRYGSPAVQSA